MILHHGDNDRTQNIELIIATVVGIGMLYAATKLRRKILLVVAMPYVLYNFLHNMLYLGNHTHNFHSSHLITHRRAIQPILLDYKEDSLRVQASPEDLSNIIMPVGLDSLYSNSYQRILSNLTKINRVVCVFGPGGSGESMLALGEVMRLDSPYQFHFQINSASDDQLLSGLEQLYEAFYGMEELDPLREESDKQVVLPKLLNSLNSKLNELGWYPAIILLDDCSQETDLLREIIYTMTHVHFIITTRNGAMFEYPDNSIAKLSLNDGWPKEDRLSFMKNLPDLEHCQELVDYLVYPLGLKIASQTIQYLSRNPSRKYTCNTYLSEMRSGTNNNDEKKC